MVPPLWKRAPLRAFTRGGGGVLLVGALLAATTSAASAPMFGQLAGEAALSATLATVPEGARTSDSPAVSLVGGRSPRSADQVVYQQRMALIPGLTTPTITGQSVGPDLHFGEVFRPVVRANGVEVGARLFATEDPSATLVVTSGSPGAPGVWLPDPVATRLGATPGHGVELAVVRTDATHPPRPKDPIPPTITLPLAGTYAVAADGRRPADPPGTAIWSRRVGGLPTDASLTTLPAYLVVGDVDTVDRASQAIGDDLIWRVNAELAPGLTLDAAKVTAAGVAELRDETQAPNGEPPGPLRLGVVSGIESLVAEADFLAGLTRQRGDLLAGAGVAAGLLTALGLAVLLVLDRRRELRHGAAVGVGPVRVLGLWSLEALLPAVVAVVLGVLVAWLVLRAAGPPGPLLATSVGTGARRAVLVGLLGVVGIGAVGAVSVVTLERGLTARPRVRVPWVAVLVVGAVVAAVAAWTTPATSPGPVALAVPALVCAAVGAFVAVLVGWAVRVVARRRTAALPRSAARASRWLAVRRLAGAGSEQTFVVSVMALGLGMTLFAMSAVAAAQVAVADRVAVANGAATVAQIDGSWLLDPDAPRLPTNEELAAGVKVPKGRTPPVPDGMTLVWRSLVSLSGEFGYRDLMAVDPAQLLAVADWGEGATMARARDAVTALAAADARAMQDPSRAAIPVIAVNEPSLRAGDLAVLSGQAWTSPVSVVASVPAFPGLRSRPMLVAATPTLFASQARYDPRLAPPDETLTNRPFAETWLWSSGSSRELTDFLAQHGVTPTALTTTDQAAQTPTIAAATRSLGYQGAVGAFLALVSVVVAAVYARRLVRRSRAADALLVRVGVGRRGVGAARTWELGLLVVVALVAAVVSVALVSPLGPLLLDLDRGASPAYELHQTWAGVAVTCAVALVMLVAAWLSGVRPSTSSRGPSPEEVLLREGS